MLTIRRLIQQEGIELGSGGPSPVCTCVCVWAQCGPGVRGQGPGKFWKTKVCIVIVSNFLNHRSRMCSFERNAFYSKHVFYFLKHLE